MTPQQLERARLIRRARRHRRHMLDAAASLPAPHLAYERVQDAARAMGLVLPLIAFVGSAFVVAVSVRRRRLPPLGLVADVAVGASRIWSLLGSRAAAGSDGPAVSPPFPGAGTDSHNRFAARRD